MPCLSGAAVVVDLGAGIDGGVVAYRHAGAYVGLGIDLDVLAYDRSIADVGEGADIAVVGYLYAIGYVAGALYASGLRLYVFCRQVEKARKGYIRIVDPDKGGLHRRFGYEISAYEHY